MAPAEDPRPRRPDPAETVEEHPEEYDALDEASMESFPASDPPSASHTQEGKPTRLHTDGT